MTEKIEVKQYSVRNDWFLPFQVIKDLQCYHDLLVSFCLVYLFLCQSSGLLKHHFSCILFRLWRVLSLQKEKILNFSSRFVGRCLSNLKFSVFSFSSMLSANIKSFLYLISNFLQRESLSLYLIPPKGVGLGCRFLD